MTDIINIPDTTITKGVTYYNVSVKLPLRSLFISKRYSEFEDLVTNLSNDLGIAKSEFPHQLPSKRIKWLHSSSTVAERKPELAKFLNSIIKDTSVQNNSILLEFLKLPLNFRFNLSLFKPTGNREGELLADLSAIDESNWLEIYRIFKSTLTDLLSESTTTINERVQRRDKVNKLLQPCLVNLTKSLSKSKLDKKEHTRREALLTELNDGLNDLLSSLQEYTAKAVESTLLPSKRVLGKPLETKDTILLNNNELLQAQVQVHQEQDQELEQLRKIIQRQREIGEAIHNEVEEQNAMLDEFNDEVYNTSEKLRTARTNAKKIL